MTERKLSPEQIDQLFAFCKKKGVKHYDLQIELVDHMASAIEQKWEETPDLSLAEALPSAYLQFGIYGFSKFHKIREKALQKKYTRLQWQYILEFYRLPKIIMTIAISLSLFTIIRLSSNITLLSLILLGIYATSLLVYFLFFHKNKSRIELTTGKSFMQIDYLNAVRGSLFAVGFVPFNLLTITSIVLKEFQFSQTSIYILELITSFSITLFIYIMIALISHVPQRIKEDFIREFPQFVKS
ncbi:MAG: hypothetical protein WCI54_06190 [Bacteroidia bacterium]